MGKTLALLLLPLLMVVGAILFLQNKSSQKLPATTSQSPPSPPTTNETQPEIKEIKVAGTEFAFSPSNITVKKGERVKLIFENKGNQNHDWAIEDLDIKTQRIKGSTQEAIEFQTPNKPGSYNIICSVPGHKEAGMVGKLLIE